MVRIGDALKKLRKEKGLSYRKLEKHVGISFNNLAMYERNEISPSLANAVKVATFFEVPVEYLVLGERTNFNYRDFELAELSARVDQADREYRDMVKGYMKQVLEHQAERKRLLEKARAARP